VKSCSIFTFYPQAGVNLQRRATKRYNYNSVMLRDAMLWQRLNAMFSKICSLAPKTGITVVWGCGQVILLCALLLQLL
jgi:hypothetical protein